MKHQRLGDILRTQGVLDDRQLRFALATQKARGMTERLGRVLIEANLATASEIVKALAQQVGWDVYRNSYTVDSRSFAALGENFCRHHGVVPVTHDQESFWVLSDGYETSVTDVLRARCPDMVRFYVGDELDIRRALDAAKPAAELSSLTVKGDGSGDALVLLQEAVDRDATDIHVEVEARSAQVRFRIDGVLHHHCSLTREEGLKSVNMFFTRAGLSAGDHGRCHDARFMETFRGRHWDIRLSHIPSLTGPSLVLRLLERARSVLSLEELGYDAKRLSRIREGLKAPNGIILFTGPTGCGKSTSLYALLNAMKGIGVKVVSAEDPVEVLLPLTTQVQVDARREQDFHDITRALLRHDPDIILIGEIRDEKTAGEAFRAAATGHRVLTTLHTNDALNALLRLRELGVDGYQLAGALRLVVAQRLVRRLCPHCHVPNGSSYAPRGCPLCLDGFKGRTVIAETLFIDTEVEELLSRNALHEAVGLCRKKQTGQTLREDARRLVNAGITSLCEIERILG